MTMAGVSLTSITKFFGALKVLDAISVDIRSGEFVSLLGASGCGKTTLLRIVAGLESVSAGSVVIDNQDVTSLPPEKRDIAMMFQSYALLPHLSVRENVRFPLRMRRIGSREEQEEKTRSALETVQLSHLAERRPRQLSGGQQQRAALARAIVSNPKVLLLDEPLSNLDARLREDMQVELKEIHRRLGLTTIFVTHDQEEALSLSDRVVLINAGRVEQAGMPDEIYVDPVTAFASNFLGAANLIPVTITGSPGAAMARLADGQSVRLKATETKRGVGTLVLRQEALELVEGTTDGIVGKVRARIYLGARNRYIISVGDIDIRVLTASDRLLDAGTTVTIVMERERMRVL
jgi:ABC-type Fe3+/spermidine/putrescine transport system ATPase subunit